MSRRPEDDRGGARRMAETLGYGKRPANYLTVKDLELLLSELP